MSGSARLPARKDAHCLEVARERRVKGVEPRFRFGPHGPGSRKCDSSPSNTCCTAGVSGRVDGSSHCVDRQLHLPLQVSKKMCAIALFFRAFVASIGHARKIFDALCKKANHNTNACTYRQKQIFNIHYCMTDAESKRAADRSVMPKGDLILFAAMRGVRTPFYVRSLGCVARSLPCGARFCLSDLLNIFLNL